MWLLVRTRGLSAPILNETLLISSRLFLRPSLSVCLKTDLLASSLSFSPVSCLCAPLPPPPPPSPPLLLLLLLHIPSSFTLLLLSCCEELNHIGLSLSSVCDVTPGSRAMVMKCCIATSSRLFPRDALPGTDTTSRQPPCPLNLPASLSPVTLQPPKTPLRPPLPPTASQPKFRKLQFIPILIFLLVSRAALKFPQRSVVITEKGGKKQAWKHRKCVR